MLQKLLIITCLLISGNILAQPGHPVPQPVHKTETDSSVKQSYKPVGSPLPPLIATTSKGKIITNNDLKIGANLFVMTFNPTCSHCMDETSMIEKNIALFNKSKILLVTTQLNRPYLPDFEKKENIEDYKTITTGIDSLEYVEKTYLYQMLPQINVYDKDHILIKTFTGDVPIDSLKPYIQ